ncbi:uncharacterized protein LOC126844394 [Adelges cooleyi]|uniref:uncharacterized protein LOC126844394 n=1 Tax=Adelges cooleyi TaxID=133065 RepID=UPI0021800246|nr:uncharacterized protein LOC126844394 [Adelges cooleyi]
MQLLFLLCFWFAIRANAVHSVGENVFMKILQYNQVIDDQYLNSKENLKNVFDQLLLSALHHFKRKITDQNAVLYLNDMHLINVDNLYINVNVSLQNIEIKGLDRIMLLDLRTIIYVDGVNCEIDLYIPELQLKADYYMYGEIILNGIWIQHKINMPQSLGNIKTNLHNVTATIATTIDVDLLSRSMEVENVSVDYDYGEANTKLLGLNIGSYVEHYAVNPIANLIVEIYLQKNKMNTKNILAEAIQQKINPVITENALSALSEAVLEYTREPIENMI